MPTENRKILIRRGNGDIPSDVQQGELLLKTDSDNIGTNKVFIGTGTGTAKAIANLTDMGVTATSTHLNFVSGASSNIQGQLNGKAALAGANFTGTVTLPATGTGTTEATRKDYVDNALALKANLAGPNLSGTPTAPTAASGTDTTQIATTAFVQGAVASVSAGVSGVSVSSDEINTLDDINTNTTVQAQLNGKAATGDLEWTFLQKITGSGSTLSVTNSSLTNHTFDVSTNDYKFVVAVETSTEDNSSPIIRLNNISATAYNYIYERATLDAITNPDTGSNTSFGGYDQTNIGTGLLLGSASQDVAMTNLQLEFIVSQSVQSYSLDGGNTQTRALLVEGNGSALAIDAPSGTPRVWPIVSRFSGSLTSSTGLTQVDIIHEITGGTTDNASVKVYKRAK
jgi:hypothetical protein